MRVVPIPCLSDNYAYLLVCTATKEAAIVDASEAQPVIDAIERGAARSSREVASVGGARSRGPGPDASADGGANRRDEARVVAILSTHHHHDHVGGNVELAERLGVAKIYGHASDRGRVPGQTHFLEDGETFTLGSLLVRALHVPGHTTGAVAYVVTREPEDPVVFTGDTLFLGGCGRMFEGDAAMMNASLQKLAALDPRTRVYCGHEYTAQNLRFAEHVDRTNPAVARAKERVAKARATGAPSVPGTIGDERAHNPFLRVGAPEIRAAVGAAADASDAAAFAKIRAAKDDFR